MSSESNQSQESTANPETTQAYWDSYGLPLVLIFGVSNAITTTVLVLRLYVRVYMVRTPGIDDAFLVFAQLLSLASLILTIVQYKKGVPEFDYNIAARNQWVTSVHWRFYDLLDSILTLTFIKLSVGALLLRFAQTRRQRVFLYCGIGVVTVTCIEWCGVTIFGCWPVSAAWNIHVAGSCISLNAAAGVYAFNSILVLITDCFFAILPIFVIRKLSFNRRTKRTLYGVVGLALFASLSSVIKLIISVVAWQNPTQPKYYFQSLIWWCIELGLAFLAAMVPVLRPLLRRLLDQNSNADESTALPSPVRRGSVTMVENAQRRRALDPRVRNWFSIDESKLASRRTQRDSITDSGTRTIVAEEIDHPNYDEEEGTTSLRKIDNEIQLIRN